jgi:hypothetical protein
VKVAINVPSTTWVPRSAIKLRSSRGPNCEDANCSATIVTENVMLVIVIIDEAMVAKTCRAPSVPLVNFQPIRDKSACPSYAPSSRTMNDDKTMAARTIAEGISQKLTRTASRIFSSQDLSFANSPPKPMRFSYSGPHLNWWGTVQALATPRFTLSLNLLGSQGVHSRGSR